MDGNKPIAVFNEEVISSIQSFVDADPDIPPEVKESAPAALNMLRNLSVEQQAEFGRRAKAAALALTAAELKFKSATESCENPEEIARAKATFDEEVNEIMERQFIPVAEFLNANNS